MRAFLPLEKLRTNDLNSFLTSRMDLNGFFPFQHSGKEGSDTSFRVLLRSPLSCKYKKTDKLHAYQFDFRIQNVLKFTAVTRA
jgi:hypothetical protein